MKTFKQVDARRHPFVKQFLAISHRSVKVDR